MANQQRSTIWVDGRTSTRQTILLGNATLAGVEAQLKLLSNADVQRSWEGTPIVNLAPAPISAQYASVADWADLLYADAAGLKAYVTLPAPIAAAFLADLETVSLAAVGALNAAVIGTVLTGSGAPVVAFLGGIRRKAGRDYQ